MKTKLLTAAALAALIATPAHAQEQRKPSARELLGRVLEAVLTPEQEAAKEAQAEAPADAVADAVVTPPTLADVLADPRRDDDRARDRYRNPAATLEFFQVEPTHTVAEWGPGGGWYTRVLAPYVMPQGTYIALNGDSDARTYPNAEAEQRAVVSAAKSRLRDAMLRDLHALVERRKGIEIPLDSVKRRMRATAIRELGDDVVVDLFVENVLRKDQLQTDG